MKYPLQKILTIAGMMQQESSSPIRDQSGKMRLCAFLSENRCITSRAVYLRQGNVSDKLLFRVPCSYLFRKLAAGMDNVHDLDAAGRDLIQHDVIGMGHNLA